MPNSWSEIIEPQWKLIMRPLNKPSLEKFFELKQFEGEYFTIHPRMRGSLGSGYPQFLVTKKEEVEGPTTFRTTVDSLARVQYDIQEVQEIAPKGANAYKTEEFYITGDEKHHFAKIEFYFVEVDQSQRIPSLSEIKEEYDYLLRLVVG